MDLDTQTKDVDLMSTLLSEMISNLGYPVGCGVAPNPETVKTMAEFALTLAEKLQGAEVRRLREALEPFCYRKDHSGGTDGDPLEGLPDGHGFEFTWVFPKDGEDDDDLGSGSCDVTAGQIRRARLALGTE